MESSVFWVLSAGSLLSVIVDNPVKNGYITEIPEEIYSTNGGKRHKIRNIQRKTSELQKINTGKSEQSASNYGQTEEMSQNYRR
jgi:hypothetical protein